MAFSLSWPWRRGARTAERKSSGGWGIVSLHDTRPGDWTRHDYATLARNGFMRNPVAHRAVRMIAEAAAAAPFLLYEGVTEIVAHPLLDLLARPNGRQSGPDLLETLYGHLLLSGNAYLELAEADGEAAELHLLRPDSTRVVTGADGWPLALEHGAGRKRRIALDDERPAALHLRLFHPLDDVDGFPPLAAAAMALDLHNTSAAWNKALLENSARPSGALVYAPKEGGNLSPDQFERLKRELEDGYQGARRAGRPLLLEGGLDWKPMALSPKDMDFLQARNGAARDIALAFGVPPMLLGIPGDNTYSNYQEANRAFYRLTVLPLVGRTTQALSNWLAPRHGNTLRLTFDADRIDGLALEREALWSRVGAADFLSDDEKREAVGYQPRGQER